jgi:hypothetical protein
LSAARSRLAVALRRGATAHDATAVVLDRALRYERADWHRLAAATARDRAAVIERALNA